MTLIWNGSCWKWQLSISIIKGWPKFLLNQPFWHDHSVCEARSKLIEWSVLKRHSKKSPRLVDSEQSCRTTAWTLLPKYSNASFKWLWLLPGGTMVDWGVNECLLLLLFKVGGMIFLCAFIYSFMYKRVDINFRVHICMWIWLQWSQERSLLTEKNTQHVFGLFSRTWLSFLILFFFIIIQSACSPL